MDQPEQWEYFVGTIKASGVSVMQNGLNRLGAEGWELVSVSTTVKTMVNMTGNDLVIVAKRRCVAPAAIDSTTPDWFDDPIGRFDKRYWDGRQWTAHVGKVGPPKTREIDPPTVLSPSEA